MAGVSTSTRDLDKVRADLGTWFVERLGDEMAYLSEFESNQRSGFSNQTLFFTLARAGCPPASYVLRMPPVGEGLFPSYEFEMQWRLQSLLSEQGLPTVAPALYEADVAWLGAPFLVMPWVPGQSPNDVTYPVKGWLHDQPDSVQRRCIESFADFLGALHTLEVGPYRQLLARPEGSGLEAELEWWYRYLLWASDGEPSPLMAQVYAWARQTSPGNPYPNSILWNDARLSNVVSDEQGRVAAALDWEQASIGPAELDIGFWLATRRQACEAMGVTKDPELPGFPSRAELVARLEGRLGRRLHRLDWHELFAMVRMGICIVGTQRVLRLSGQVDHFIAQAPLLPKWAVHEMGLD